MSRVRRVISIAVIVGALASACGQQGGPPGSPAGPEPAVAPSAVADSPPIVIALAGDIMLARRVGAVVATDPDSIFEAVRHTLTSADLALGNLESPLGDVALGSDERLVAAPAAARLLQRAGFDVVNVANNHAGDAGVESVVQTAAELETHSIAVVGTLEAGAPVIRVVRSGRLSVAVVGFDLTRQGPAEEVAHWDATVAEVAVAAARASADIVAVSVHGGVEHLPRPDPALRRVVEQLASWGVDVVWAHGAHTMYDVEAVDANGDGRSTIVAYGLGNFLFDQRLPGSEEGLLLEVMAGSGGVVAYRSGIVHHGDLRVSAPSWSLPAGSAALIDGAWWAVVAEPEMGDSTTVDRESVAQLGHIAAVGVGDVDGDGIDDVVATFRRPNRPTLVKDRFSNIDWADAAGHSAHLGVYALYSLRPKWVAGSMSRPVVDLEVCDGAVALAFGALDHPGTEATGAWWWRDFGFAAAPILDGPGAVGCSDIDRDGSPDPVLIRNSGP